MRYFTCLLIVFAGSSAKPLDPQQMMSNLKSQAEAMGQAAIQDDHSKMADFTHPMLIEKIGGREKFLSMLETVSKDLKNRGFQIKKYTVGEPSKPVHASGTEYALIPSEIEMSGPGGKKGLQESYSIGVSEDGGLTWKFVDGGGFAGDRSKAKTLFPNFPDEIPLTVMKKANWDNP